MKYLPVELPATVIITTDIINAGEVSIMTIFDIDNFKVALFIKSKQRLGFSSMK